jgi:hypothetical protein
MRDRSGLRTVEVIQSLGVDGVGRRYIALLVADLEAIRRGERAPRRDETEDLIHDAVWIGEDELGQLLPITWRWELVLSALAACPDDDRLLWCLGDGPFDHLRGDGDDIDDRIRLERSSNPKLQRLSEAMRRTLPADGVTSGPWFE